MNEPTAPVLDHQSVREMPAFAEVMPRVAAEYGRSLSGQLRDLVAYCYGGNKLLVDEYYQLRLFDDATYTPAQKKRFVGLRKSREIWNRLCEINPWLGVIDDKLAYEKMMLGFGFPVAETLAVIGGHYPDGHPRRIADEAGLAAYLSGADFPLFGKPIDSLQSLGSVRIEGFDAKSGEVRLGGGRAISVAAFWREVMDRFGGGYLFQSCIEADPALARICGGGVPTVRVVTLDRGAGPEIYRTSIKLTGGGNVADNFWRKGNLIAPVDPVTGSMGSALTGFGIDGAFVDDHPDTGAKIAGVVLPHWQACRDLALAAAGVTQGSLVLGFDIALSKHGPVLIEANYTPDLIMLQACSGEGILDETMTEALDHAKRMTVAKKEFFKTYLKDERARHRQEMSGALSRKAG